MRTCILLLKSHVSYMLLIFITGTGKSETGAHLAYIFSVTNQRIAKKCPIKEEQSLVLYCGPSNKSVDVVHGKYSLMNE